MKTNSLASFQKASLPLAAMTAIVFAAFALAGCTAPAPDPTPKVNVIEREFKASPQDALAQAKQALADLGVESEEKGSIVTGWEQHRGDFHIARYWQERTRYRVTVVPDWDTPDKRCRIQVVQETQQRATDGQTWKVSEGLVRNDRARAILEKISAAMK